MCTIISVLPSNPEDSLMFLENRDRPSEGFTGNSVVTLSEGRVIAIYDNRSRGIACGYSMDTGIYGGIANILGHMGTSSRGILLKNILTKMNDLDQAVKKLVNEIKKGLYSSAVYILGDQSRIARVESFNQNVSVTFPEEMEVATNYFHYLKKGKRSGNSPQRERYVRNILNTRSQVRLDDLFEIAKHHEKKKSVCKHGRTLSSLLFEIPNQGAPRFLYAEGRPCNGYVQYTP